MSGSFTQLPFDDLPTSSEAIFSAYNWVYLVTVDDNHGVSRYLYLGTIERVYLQAIVNLSVDIVKILLNVLAAFGSMSSMRLIGRRRKRRRSVNSNSKAK